MDFSQDSITLPFESVDHPVRGEKWMIGLYLHEMPPKNCEDSEPESVFFDNQCIPARAGCGEVGGPADKGKGLNFVFESLLIPYVISKCDRIHAKPFD